MTVCHIFFWFVGGLNYSDPLQAPRTDGGFPGPNQKVAQCTSWRNTPSTVSRPAPEIRCIPEAGPTVRVQRRCVQNSKEIVSKTHGFAQQSPFFPYKHNETKCGPARRQKGACSAICQEDVDAHVRV